MSSCRVERKRAHDREAQRASRAKTKAYISHLEKTVADLTESTGDNRANYLAHHASKQAQEIDGLQGLVNKIRSLVQEASSSSKRDGPFTDGSHPSRVKAEGSVVESICGDGSVDFPFSTREVSDSSSEGHHTSEAAHFAEHGHTSSTTQACTVPATRNPNVLGVNIGCEDSEDCSYILRLNDAITKVEHTPDILSSIHEDEDIMVRAIVHGWDAAERLHHFDIVWRFVRAYDDGLWHRAGKVERLATLWQMRNTMLHKISPKNQQQRPISSFMAPTEKQLSCKKRPPVVDYFGWPPVRNHLLAQGIGNCSGTASIAFAENFRFVWDYDLRDCFKINKSTGIFSVSEAFNRSWNDICSYRMLQCDLIPYYVHPNLAQAAPISSTAIHASFEDQGSDEEVDEEVIRFADAQLPNIDSILQDCGHQTGEWMQNFDISVSKDVLQCAMDPFTLSHQAGLSQWPAL
ncbi:hypothetical protein DOTSEDRAFT_75535 [Dothistroma septosporum NZE10]|uniref:BZIP domain-containing protein n=1 Tax=Dothistroma septosporum (strain NZE10 / CBS 128990) TaxID=675120 RepID=M2YIT1_DOTSN|nr:hypothetical protein DOTSEDRAFT_75535 [Dothistroma septosporum NZE10]